MKSIHFKATHFKGIRTIWYAGKAYTLLDRIASFNFDFGPSSPVYIPQQFKELAHKVDKVHISQFQNEGSSSTDITSGPHVSSTQKIGGGQSTSLVSNLFHQSGPKSNTQTSTVPGPSVVIAKKSQG